MIARGGETPFGATEQQNFVQSPPLLKLPMPTTPKADHHFGQQMMRWHHMRTGQTLPLRVQQSPRRFADFIPSVCVQKKDEVNKLHQSWTTCEVRTALMDRSPLSSPLHAAKWHSNNGIGGERA